MWKFPVVATGDEGRKRTKEGRGASPGMACAGVPRDELKGTDLHARSLCA